MSALPLFAGCLHNRNQCSMQSIGHVYRLKVLGQCLNWHDLHMGDNHCLILKVNTVHRRDRNSRVFFILLNALSE